MANSVRCPHCGHTHLKRIRVRGIRKCASCQNFVDIRKESWWRKVLSA
ncbi:transposase [Leptolyngbya sp. PCC 6406]|nr:transposase [Leptolyngbya sp. PCC 6406]